MLLGTLSHQKILLFFTSGLREGTMVNPTDFPRAIKRLWQLGLFQDIQLKYDKETEEGLFLTIQVKENFILGEIKYEGNKKIKDTKFDEELDMTKGQRIKSNSLSNAENIIKNLYKDKGYLNAKVDSELIVPIDKPQNKISTNNQLTRDVIFKISEKSKVKINKIHFEGNNSFFRF